MPEWVFKAATGEELEPLTEIRCPSCNYGCYEDVVGEEYVRDRPCPNKCGAMLELVGANGSNL
jgi:hypothetical protein